MICQNKIISSVARNKWRNRTRQSLITAQQSRHNSIENSKKYVSWIASQQKFSSCRSMTTTVFGWWNTLRYLVRCKSREHENGNWIRDGFESTLNVVEWEMNFTQRVAGVVLSLKIEQPSRTPNWQFVVMVATRSRHDGEESEKEIFFHLKINYRSFIITCGFAREVALEMPKKRLEANGKIEIQLNFIQWIVPSSSEL